MTIQEEALEVVIKSAAQIFNLDPATLGSDTRFADLGCKSVDYVKISVALEDAFEIEVPYMVARRFETFADAGNFIAKEIEG